MNCVFPLSLSFSSYARMSLLHFSLFRPNPTASGMVSRVWPAGRVSIESAVEKSQYSARVPHVEFDSSGNSISASCRKPQVICARPVPSRHPDATAIPRSLLRERKRGFVALVPRIYRSLGHRTLAPGKPKRPYCSMCLSGTYREYSPTVYGRRRRDAIGG